MDHIIVGASLVEVLKAVLKAHLVWNLGSVLSSNTHILIHALYIYNTAIRAPPQLSLFPSQSE